VWQACGDEKQAAAGWALLLLLRLRHHAGAQLRLLRCCWRSTAVIQCSNTQCLMACITPDIDAPFTTCTTRKPCCGWGSALLLLALARMSLVVGVAGYRSLSWAAAAGAALLSGSRCTAKAASRLSFETSCRLFTACWVHSAAAVCHGGTAWLQCPTDHLARSNRQLHRRRELGSYFT
jgi:hypothetical protein